MKLLIRLDANEDVGMGHLIRCLELASCLQNSYGVNPRDIYFLTSGDEVSVNSIKERGFQICLTDKSYSEEYNLRSALIDGKYKLVFIDKIYPYSYEFITDLKEYSTILMFHNFCDGCFASDVYILPSGHTEDEILIDPRWENNEVACYFGLDYVIINNSFKNIISREEGCFDEKCTVVLTTGGSDPKGILLDLLEWSRNVDSTKYKIIALYGKAFKHQSEILRVQSTLPAFIELKPFDPEEFGNADIVFTTFGVTVYELIYLSRLILTIGHTKRHALLGGLLEKRYKASINTGYYEDMDENVFLDFLARASDPVVRKSLTQKVKPLIDGKGVERVSKIVNDLLIKH